MAERIVLASAARTATVNSDAYTDAHAEAVHVIVNVTALAATPSVVPKIQGRDPASGGWYDVLVGAAITDVTVGTPPSMTVLKVGPGIGAAAGGSASDVLPDTWRVRMEHADTDSITYSVGAVIVE